MNAGYPNFLFTFHSFRSGFICTVVMKNNLDETERTAVFEVVSQVAGWSDKSRCMHGYVKEALKKTIVTTRLTNNPDHQLANYPANFLHEEVRFKNLK